MESKAPLELLGTSPVGVGVSPYDLEFTVGRYPWLFLGAGRLSKENYHVDGGMLEQVISTDTDASDNVKIVFVGDIMCMNKVSR